ncbi:TIGR02679 family protein [Streptomyces sp. NPDC088400]|uniref:TIGR02679 family protein n=1 Tax=Streptomyces sp. NPDC088400 TaxID=3365861 RepID=UPI0038297B2B
MDVTPEAYEDSQVHEDPGAYEAPGAYETPDERVSPEARESPSAYESGHATEEIDRPRLKRLLGGPEMAWLVERVRRRLEREAPLTTTLTLTDPSEAQRAAAERLLGRAPGSGRSLTVRLGAVDDMLRRSGISPDGLQAAVLALTGPVVPLREMRDGLAHAWREAYTPLDALLPRHPQLADWISRLRSDGVVRRLARTPEAAHALLTRAAAVLHALPADPAASLPAFAARTADGAHALDDGTPLATVVLSGVRALTGFPDGTGARWRRGAWASAGLLKDDLSSTVLTLNLRGTPALDWSAQTGEPAVLTLRQLTHHPPAATAAPLAVRTCENPAVLSAAADAYGPRAPALVCLQGQPSAAALVLLDHLHAHGATLFHHGDFDWGGLRIAATLLRHVPWQPWRYTATDYRAAAARTPHAPRLTGIPADAPWDSALPGALAELGVRVEEESVLDDLLRDLAEPASRFRTGLPT